MKDTIIILASASPRRKALLRQIALPFMVLPSDCEELCDIEDSAARVLYLATAKAEDVADKIIRTALLPDEELRDVLVLGADTLVCLEGRILGKPENKADAVRMLELLSGRVHEVLTGVCLLRLQKEQGQWRRTGQAENFCERTKVHFADMSVEDISAYIESGEAEDKAGAYGIQGMAARYINKIDGDYNNVVGLPLSKLWYTVRKMLGEEQNEKERD